MLLNRLEILGRVALRCTVECAIASLGMAMALLPSVVLAQVVKEPPELRIVQRQLSLPEFAMTQSVGAAALAAERTPFADSQGRIRYIVELNESAKLAYSNNQVPPDGMPDWHQGSTRNLIADMAKTYSFAAVNMTSWAGSTVTAYLSPSQVKAIEQDARVKRVVVDGKSRPSAPLWSDSTGLPFVSWGTIAVGHAPSVVSNVTVYVLDSGVGQHTDLNVTERLNSVGQVNPVGCYAHSVHVAGIIGANGGTLGIAPGVPIVSVASNDFNDNFNPCSFVLTPGSYADSNVIAALDLIKLRITQGGHVGIVNISQNGTSYSTSGIIGQHIGVVANPAVGYAGAFVVESAGNDFQDACAVAAAPTPIVAVVGAIDANGQPVQPLNGRSGFQNLPTAADQRGSNYGSCVTVWAPGNKIYSSWAASSNPTGGLPVQRSDTPYSAHAFLSGTSMAAPHIAGMAAYLASAYNLTTPLQIATAVSARTFSLGSHSASPQHELILTANITGARPTAVPTAEFLIEGLANGEITRNADQWFNLRYDSVGASSCTITAYINGSLWYQVLNYQYSYDWGNVQLVPGTYLWTIDCVGGNGTHGTASAIAHILPVGPSAQWLVNGSDVTGTTVELPTANPISLKYTASSATYCNLHTRNGLTAGALAPWYAVNGMPTTYDWGVVQYGPAYYEYTIDCFDGANHTQTATFLLHVF